jgi:hypothetical protein
MISCAEAVPIGNRCDFQSHNGDEEESPRERTIQVQVLGVADDSKR